MKGLDDEIVTLPTKVESPKEPSQFTLPRDFLSASQVGMYHRCPRMYEFRYIKGVVSPPGIAMAMGTAVHHAVENIHQATIDTGKPLPLAPAQAAFSDKWDNLHEEIEFAPVDDDDPSTEENTKDMGIALLGKYYKEVLPSVRPVEVEKRVEFSVKGVPMVGYVDLVDKAPNVPANAEPCTCSDLAARKDCPKSLLCNLSKNSTVVADTKVVRRKKSQNDADSDLQLTGYAYALDTTNVRFDALIKSVKNPRVDQVSSTRTASDFRWYEEVIVGVADGISRGYFPPCPPDSWCCTPKFCGYWSSCRGKKS